MKEKDFLLYLKNLQSNINFLNNKMYTKNQLLFNSLDNINYNIFNFNDNKFNIGDKNISLSLNGSNNLTYNDKKVLTEQDYIDGNVDAAPLSNAFFIDKNFRILAPNYDSNNNRLGNNSNYPCILNTIYNYDTDEDRYLAELHLGCNNVKTIIWGSDINISSALIANNTVTMKDVLTLDNKLILKENIGIQNSNGDNLFVEKLGYENNFLEIGNDSSTIHLYSNNIIIKSGSLCMNTINGTWNILNTNNNNLNFGNSSLPLNLLGESENGLNFNGYSVLTTKGDEFNGDIVIGPSHKIQANYDYFYYGKEHKGTLDLFKTQEDNIIIGDKVPLIISATNLYCRKYKQNENGNFITEYTSPILDKETADNRYLQINKSDNTISIGSNDLTYDLYSNNIIIRSGSLYMDFQNNTSQVLSSSNGELVVGDSSIPLNLLGKSENGLNFNGYSILQVGSSIGIKLLNNTTIEGDLSASGAKNCIQETKSFGKRLFYSVEDGESLLTWSNKLKTYNTDSNKIIKIDIDEIYKECVDLENDYIVEIYKESFGDYKIKEKTKDYFIIESNIPNFKFKFTIKAHRKGYENRYLDKY